MSNFTKPQVTIDLDEYLHLKQVVREQRERIEGLQEGNPLAKKVEAYEIITAKLVDLCPGLNMGYFGRLLADMGFQATYEGDRLGGAEPKVFLRLLKPLDA